MNTYYSCPLIGSERETPTAACARAGAGLGLIKRNVGTRPMRVIAAITYQATRKACTHSATS
ncbi:hypothetical protein V1282_004336 [Nitrobacteraceae bacterium AZCC 2146]